jgi:caspase domain-containing protein
LIDGAAMPQPSALPDSIKSFSFINAAEVDDGRDFHQHMERVERSIDAVFRQKSSRSGSIRLPILATAMVAAVVVGLATWMFAPHLLGSRNPLVETPPAKREAQAPQINTPTVPAPDASAPRRGAALVIGNSNYQRAPKLVTPANDATAMGQQLKAAGYNTITKLDVGNLEFKRALREFDDAAQAADIGIVYFGGHGLSVRGTDYLLPVDARLATEYDVADETIALDRILFAMESLTSLRLLILDASRDNPFARTMKRSSPGTPGLDKTEPASGNTLIAFAAKAGTVAEEGNGPNSVFVTALLKNLFVPGLDIRLALGRVRDDVLRATNNRQEPFVYGSLGGQVVTLVAKN